MGNKFGSFVFFSLQTITREMLINRCITSICNRQGSVSVTPVIIYEWLILQRFCEKSVHMSNIPKCTCCIFKHEKSLMSKVLLRFLPNKHCILFLDSLVLQSIFFSFAAAFLLMSQKFLSFHIKLWLPGTETGGLLGPTIYWDAKMFCDSGFMCGVFEEAAFYRIY